MRWWQKLLDWLSGGGQVDPPPDPPADPDPDMDLVRAEINRERMSRGLPAYFYDARLERAAHLHSADQHARGRMGHDGSDGSDVRRRIERQGYHWTACGETVAENQRTAAEVVSSWMHSPGHRRELLSVAYTQFGVGCVGWYWTAVFAHP